ncbi:hypothetical protein IMSAG049_01535 [Clostridiales bacterium]|nr:hypothetical protein IMSAG049_01535 [Clostridiales bacterium]
MDIRNISIRYKILFLALSSACMIAGIVFGVYSTKKLNYFDKSNSIEKERIDGNGYYLLISEEEKIEAETDCMAIMELISPIYIKADKGSSINAVVPKETIGSIAEAIGRTGNAVITMEEYSDMKNYTKIEDFLNTSAEETSGSAIIYRVHGDGGIEREKFIYDGKDMYDLSARAIWNEKNEPVITDISYSRINKWKFENDWFCYELCVPEPPDVSEIVNSNYLIRVKPISEENREASIKFVLGLGYQGNNILCSNWDINNMEALDYNGMYEYLYVMKYNKPFLKEEHKEGIPKSEFESLIMDYFPITAEELSKYAAFDDECGNYVWAPLFCMNYSPNYFGTSVPEVTAIRENTDGTLTLTVNAVCEMLMCDEAVITHELTVKTKDDGSFKYLGNKILADGIEKIPEYQYRLGKK